MMFLIPAYGRDYKSAKAVKADWQAGKDFIVSDISHPYDMKPVSIRDLKQDSYVLIRYDKLRKVTKA